MNIEQLLQHQTKTVGNTTDDRLVFVRNKNLQVILNRFDKVEHRLELVTKFRGVTFVNDAKSMTINEVYYSFETIKQKIVWIAGGKEQQTDLSDLSDLVAQKVKVIICIGDNMEQIRQCFSPYVLTILERKSMEEAVMTAFYAAEENETVLLSPACNTNYTDYIELGTTFKKAIAQL